VTDEGKQLGRLVDHMIGEVHERCDRKQDRHAARDLNCPRYSREFLPRPARAPAPAAKASEEAVGFCWHALWGGMMGRAAGKRYQWRQPRIVLAGEVFGHDYRSPMSRAEFSVRGNLLVFSVNEFPKLFESYSHRPRRNFEFGEFPCNWRDRSIQKGLGEK
jgi:hypothetical protein